MAQMQQARVDARGADATYRSSGVGSTRAERAEARERREAEGRVYN